MTGKHPRRLLICGPVFLTGTVGGLPFALNDMADRLRTRGWSVDLAITPENLGLDPSIDATRAPSGASRLLPRLRFLPTDVRTILQHVAQGGGTARLQSAVMDALDKRLAAIPYDVVMTVVERESPGLAHFVTGRHPRVALLSLNGLATELRLAPWSGMARAASRVVYRHSLRPSVYTPISPRAVRLALFASEAWREDAIGAGLAPEVARTIYFGVDDAGPLPGPTPTTGRLLWVGRHSREKGLHTFLDALAVLRRSRPVTLTAVCAAGPEDYRAFVRRRIQALDLSTAVDVVGPIPHSDLARVYASHDLLLFQSPFVEPVALVLMEAFAAGLPVVGPAPTGRVGLIRPDETCICFPSPSSTEIARAMARGLDDEALRETVRQRAHTLVRGHFLADSAADEYDRVLREFVAAPGRAEPDSREPGLEPSVRNPEPRRAPNERRSGAREAHG